MITRSHVIDVDKGWNAIKLGLTRVAAQRVGQVGIFAGPSHPESGVPVAAYAYTMEYGGAGGRIPPRPFVAHTMDTHERRIFELMRSEVSLFYASKGSTAGTLLTVTVKEVEDLMVGEVLTAKDWARPLSPYTVALKGHDLPLLDTFALVNAITSRITTRGQLRRRLAREGA